MPLDQPQDLPHAFARAWMDRDASALAALFSEDADFVNVVGLWWENASDIRKAHHYGLTTFFRDSRLTVGRVKLRLIGDGAAVVQARLTLTGQIAQDGQTAGTRRTILTTVLERRADGWIAVAAQNTDIVPGAETHVATDTGFAPADYRRSD